MTDNELMALLISTLAAGMTAQGVTVGIKQNYQPSNQGTPAQDTLFIFKLHDNRYGFPGRKDVFDTNAQVMNHTENEYIEATYQLNALSIQNPANTTQLTPNDLLRLAGRVLQSQSVIASFKSQGIGIYRIQAITTVFFIDDKGREEANPFLTFTTCRTDAFTVVIPSTDVLIPAVTPMN